ncbi:MAG: type II toxin-antitoxin system RelE/ParE family toxin [Candidatus Aminicenantes bacterium]|nr:MAG: type II toxin-antitoxin system RelE/ParE family toxin [Candidatus Aminicenantes bacterium]
MTKLNLAKTFQKKYQTLPRGVQAGIEEALKDIAQNPYAGKKLMVELEGEFSYRIGRFRIIYFVDEKQNVWIETVSQRKDVYRK